MSTAGVPRARAHEWIVYWCLCQPRRRPALLNIHVTDAPVLMPRQLMVSAMTYTPAGRPFLYLASLLSGHYVGRSVDAWMGWRWRHARLPIAAGG